MQVKKDDIRSRILAVAHEEFMRFGFAGASMRRIASLSGVGVANVYNYFSGKDEIFCQVVGPAVRQMERILDEHHGSAPQEDIMSLKDASFISHAVDQYVSLIQGHRGLLSLLLFKAQGSSLEHYREDFTERSTTLVCKWFDNMKARYPSVNSDFSKLFLHIHAAWLFTFVEEVVMHHVNGDELRRLVRDYIRFEVSGWAALVGLDS